MAFVLAIQAGKNQSDAYRLAYDCDKRSQAGIWADASTLASSQKVSVWLEHIKTQRITQGITELEYTKERYLKDMGAVAEAAKENKAWSTFFKATEAIGKSCGHIVNAVEISHTNKADNDLLQQLEKVLGKEASIEAARRMGYKTDEHTTH